MQSAFGIEHGEVAKAFRAPRPKKGYVPRGGGQTGPQKTKGALHRIGEADISLKNIGTAAGRGMKGTGGFLERHPGLTGTALVGGGGAAGYKYLSTKPRKKGS